MVCTVSKVTSNSAAKGTDYYLSMADSTGREVQAERDAVDYRTGPAAKGRETAGRWWCSTDFLEAEMGIRSGSVALEEDVRMLYGGIHPVTGQQFYKHPAKDQGDDGDEDAGKKRGASVKAFDLTFAAPKSASVLWTLLTDEQDRQKVISAHEEGVKAALHYVFSKHAAITRTGKDGNGPLMPVSLVAAMFTQGDSRPVHENGDEKKNGKKRKRERQTPGDPHIHTHTLLFNWGRGEDGKYRTLDGRRIFDIQLEAGRIYEAEMARILSAELGVKINRPGQAAELSASQSRNAKHKPRIKPPSASQAGFEIEGIDHDLCHQMSKRSTQIAKLTGQSQNAKARATAQKNSRTGKEDHEWTDRHAFWRQELEAKGWTEESITEMLEQTLSQKSEPVREEPNWSSILPSFLDNEAVESRSKLEARIAGALIGRDFSTEEIQHISARILDEEFIPTGEDEKKLGPQFTSKKTVVEELQIREIAQAMGKSRQHALTQSQIIAMLDEYPTLGVEQRRMVEIALGTTDLTIVEGAAGSGKSFCLEPISKAYRRAGYTVIGASTAWEATGVLKESIGVECLAIAKWHAYWQNGKKLPNARTVLILDEAAMSSRSDAIAMLAVAREHGCKVILTGDRQQFSPVGAGDPVQILSANIPSESQMRIRETRRQRDMLDRAAATALSDGQPDVMMQRSKDVGSWHKVESSIEAIELAASLWRQKHERGIDTVVIAGTNAEVVVLSNMIRDQMIAEGVVDSQGHTVTATDRTGMGYDLTIAKGDIIRFQKTHKEQGIRNRSLGRVIDVTEEGIKFEHLLNRKGGKSSSVFISWEELADEKGRCQVELAYAMTAHASQGLTVEDTIMCLANGTNSTNKHYAYVVGSRHKGRCEWIINYGTMRSKIRLDRGDDINVEVGDDEVEKLIMFDFKKKAAKKNAIEVLAKNGVNVSRLTSRTVDIREDIEGQLKDIKARVVQARQSLPAVHKLIAAGKILAEKQQRKLLAQVAVVVPKVRKAVEQLQAGVQRLQQQTAQLIERKQQQAQQLREKQRAEQERRDAEAMAAIRQHRAARAGKPITELVAQATDLLPHIDQFRRSHDQRDFTLGLDRAAALAADPGWRASPGNVLLLNLVHGLETRASKSLAEHHIVDLNMAVRSLRHRDPDHRAGAMDRIVRELDAVTWRHRTGPEQLKLDRDLAFVLKQSARLGYDLHAEVGRRAAPGSDLADRLARFAQQHGLDLRPATAQELRRQQQREGQGLGRE